MSLEKKREKRSRTTPSESRTNFFVKNVKSQLAGMLPEAIANFFTGPSTSNANGSAKTSEATDSSSDDDASESSVVAPPRPKRMRYNSPDEFNRTSMDTNLVMTEGDNRDVCGTIQSPPGRTTSRREPTCASTPMRTPGETHTSNNTNNDSYTPKTNIIKVQNHYIPNPSAGAKRKSLYDSPSISPPEITPCATTSSNTTRDPRQPSLKPTFLFPFYTQRTMYGDPVSHVNRSNVVQRRTALANESNGTSTDNTNSSAAQRISCLLHDISSPLNEAKRIPKQYHNSEPCCNHVCSSLSTYKGPSFKTQELRVNNTANILRLRKRLKDTTGEARQIIASHSSTVDVLPHPSVIAQRKRSIRDSVSDYDSKIKEKESTEREKDTYLDNSLHTEFQLKPSDREKDNSVFPNFVHSTPFSTPSSISSREILPSAAKQVTLISNRALIDTAESLSKSLVPETVASYDPYKFTGLTMTPPKYTFSDPETIDNQKKGDQRVMKAKRRLQKAQIEHCVCDGITKAEMDSKKLATYSICKRPKYSICNDACRMKRYVTSCAKCVKNQKGKSKLAIGNTDTEKWKCQDCWVNNEATAKACVCCGAQQPISAGVKERGSSKLVIEKTDTGKWKCEDCWVNNEPTAKACVCCGSQQPKSAGIKQNIIKGCDSDKCPITYTDSSMDKSDSCGAAKPGTKPGSVPTPASRACSTSLSTKPYSSFKPIANQQSGKWDCPNCLVRNECNKTKCACCETEKAGAMKLPEPKTFCFGINTKTFKFGIDPKVQEANITKSVEMNSTAWSKPKVGECETNNNVLLNTASFSFCVPAEKYEDQIDAHQKVDNKVDNDQNLNVTFGVSKSESAPTAVSIFGTPNKIPELIVTKVKEKQDEIPNVDVTIPTSSKSLEPTTPMFGSPPVSKVPIFSTPNKMPELIVTELIEKPHDIPKGDLTIPTSSKLLEPPKPMFGSPPVSKVPIFSTPNKMPDLIVTELIEKPHEIPKGDLTIPTSSKLLEPPKPMFGSPPVSKATEAVSSLAAHSLYNATAPAENKTATIDNLTQQPVATCSEIMQSPSAFTFTSTAVKPTVNLFGPPASTAASNNMFAAPLQAPPNTATDPGFPMATVSPSKFNFTSNSSPYFFVDPNDKVMPQTEDNVAQSHYTPGTEKTVAPKNIISDVKTIGSGNESSSNALCGGGNGLSDRDKVVVANPLSTNALELGLQMSSHPLGGNAAAPAQGSIFGTPIPKEHMWSSNNNSNVSNNLFVSNATTNSLAKATFTFGASTSFTTDTTPFTVASTPVFQANPQQPSNPFEMASQNNHQPLFGRHVPCPPAPVFRRPQASNPAPPLSVFGTPSAGMAPTFGAPNLSNQPFEAPSLTSAQAPAFNFGSAQTTGVFGFGQQQQPQTPQQPQQPHPTAGLYNFAGLPSNPGQVQFSMGSAPMRKVRKAVRRNPPR